MNRRGITLMETLLYCALLGILAAGALPAGYALLSAAERGREDVRAAQEAAFVAAKVDWALSEARAGGVSIADDGGLSIRTRDPARDPIVVRGSDSQICLRSGAGACDPLTSPYRQARISFSQAAGTLAVRIAVARATLTITRPLP